VKRLLTLPECCVWLGRSRATLRQWQSRGQIEPVACVVKTHALLYDVFAVSDQARRADTRRELLRLTQEL
jgi:predicted site-specific integrase-resolvase